MGRVVRRQVYGERQGSESEEEGAGADLERVLMSTV